MVAVAVGGGVVAQIVECDGRIGGQGQGRAEIQGLQGFCASSAVPCSKEHCLWHFALSYGYLLTFLILANVYTRASANHICPAHNTHTYGADLGDSKHLIVTHAEDVNMECHDYRTPLHAASHEGHVDVCACYPPLLPT